MRLRELGLAGVLAGVALAHAADAPSAGQPFDLGSFGGGNRKDPITITADGLEFDVRLTADQQLAVVHDDTVDRTSDGSGPVAALRLPELKELDAGSWFGAQFAGERFHRSRNDCWRDDGIGGNGPNSPEILLIHHGFVRLALARLP